MFKKGLISLLFVSLLLSGVCLAMAEGPPSELEEFKGTELEMIKPSQAVANIAKITKENENVFPKVSKLGDIAFQSKIKDAENFNIFVYTDKGMRMVTNDTHNNQYPVFAGEKKIVFESDRLDLTKLWKIDVSGKGGIVQLTSGNTFDLMPDVSPDGKKIVYCSFWKKPRVELSATEIGARWKTIIETPFVWMVDVDGRNLTQFGEGIKPAWSSDGKKVAFYKKSGEFFNIWIMDADGGNMTEFTSGKYNTIEPAWSPDGKRIAYSSNSAGNYDIWVQNVDGTELTQLTIHNGYDGAPAWSPDGEYIYFHSFRGGSWNIWRMKLLKEETSKT